MPPVAPGSIGFGGSDSAPLVSAHGQALPRYFPTGA
jgi:hypothetical protein